MKNNKILYILTLIIILFSFNANVYAAQELTCIYNKGVSGKIILAQNAKGELSLFVNDNDVPINGNGWQDALKLDYEIDMKNIKSDSYINENKGNKCAVLCYSEELEYYRNVLADVTLYEFGKRDDELEQAHHLFAILLEADKESYDVIFAPLPPKSGIGLALYNRMIRAAAHRIISLRR